MMSKLSKIFKRLAFLTLIAASVVGLIIAFMYLGWIQFFGWIYSIAFAISAIPEAVVSIRRGRVDMSDGTLICWILGEIGGLVYGIGLMQWPLIFNCSLNAIFVSIIVYYRLRPRC